MKSYNYNGAMRQQLIAIFRKIQLHSLLWLVLPYGPVDSSKIVNVLLWCADAIIIWQEGTQWEPGTRAIAQTDLGVD